MIDKIKMNHHKKVATTTMRLLVESFSIFMLILMATCADSWSSVNQSSFTEIHHLNDTPYHTDYLSISGPDSGYVGENYEYCMSIISVKEGANDCEYEGHFGWGDKTGKDVTAKVIETKYGIPSCQLCASHAWKIAGTYTVSAMAMKKLKGGIIKYGPILDAQSSAVTIKNNRAPQKPNRIMGYTLVKTGQTFSYSTSTTDPDNHEIAYIFEWRDETPDTITDLVASGTSISVDHTWEKEGTYEARVKAIDSLNAESAWSDPIRVTVIRRQ